jgi:ubiquinone/menaquinone biosynthesis C-methylase UbiE
MAVSPMSFVFSPLVHKKWCSHQLDTRHRIYRGEKILDYFTLLARLGEGSAHPGGFQATKELIRQINLPPDTKTLEVGCGTGRTACYLASLGYDVTAMDGNEEMIEKVKRRAKLYGASIQIVQADATSMPFAEAVFDVVFVESVTAFTKGRSALLEYWRVLKPGGILYDRELALNRKLPSTHIKELQSFYGLKHLRTVPEWLRLLRKSHFRKVSVSRLASMTQQSTTDNDPYQVIEPDLMLDQHTLNMIMENERLMNRFSNVMGGIVITAWKT